MDLLYFLSWYLAATLAGWIAFPLIYRLFCFLPDRGIAFAKAAGLLLVMFLFWLLGSFGFLHNDNSGLLLAVLILVGVQAAWLKKDGLANRLSLGRAARPLCAAVRAVCSWPPLPAGA